MRLLLLNPNTTQAMTDQMVHVAESVAGPGTQIVAVTATRGVPYIASRAEAQIAGSEVLEILAEKSQDCDAVVIAAFGDPGIIAARELFDIPIVGMAEAAVMTAALLGQRFSVVTFSPHLARWYEDCVAQTGLGTRFTGVRCPEIAPENLENVAEVMRSDLMALAMRATTEDHADVVILGGAPLAGLAPQMQEHAQGILVDPIAAATLQAEALARLAPSFNHKPSRPAAKVSTGLGPALAAIIAGETS